MFEGIVSDLLIKYLGQYVKNLNRDNLNIGVFSGDVLLEQLEISEDALSSLDLPFGVKKGVIGSLKLKVPWTNLKSEPVVVHVENVFLLLEPEYSYTEYDEKKEQRREAQNKQKKLDNAELMKQFRERGDDKEGDSFTQRLVTKIVDNLQIEVVNVHVRFEDVTSNKDFPFAFGMCVESLKIQSTDAEWNPTYRTDSVIYKLAGMKNLSFYLDPIDQPSVMTTEQMMAYFVNTIATDGRKPPHHFLMNPVSAYLRLRINTSDAPSLEVPKITASIVIEDVVLQLEDLQYQTILKLVDQVSKYEGAKKYLKYRPTKTIKEGGAREWWAYAINSIRDEVRETLHNRSWKYLDQRRRDRKGYVELYKRKQKVKWLKPLDKTEEETLRNYERDLRFEDIIFFRSLADAELKAESKHQEVIDEEKKSDPKKSGLLGWLVGQSTAEKEEEANTVQLTEQQKLALYSTIDYNEVFEEIDLPREYVKLKVTVEVSSASFALVTAPKGSTSPTLLISSVLKSIRANAFVRPDSMLLDLGIKSFTAEDLYTENTQFKQIITRSQSSQIDKDFLQLVFERNPLDKHADFIVDLKMEPLDIVVYKPAWTKIQGFFSTPESVDVVEIQTRAVDTINQLSAQTRTQLEDTLKTRKNIDLFVQVAAPLIIIPEDPSQKTSPLLVLDLGRLSAKSDLRPQVAEFNKEDLAVKESESYDKFELSLDNVKVLLVPDNTLEWRSKEVQQKNKLFLVEEFSFKLQVEKSIVPTEISLTQLKLSGDLPQLRLDFSPKKTGQLVRLVNVLLGRGATPPHAPPPPPTRHRRRRQSVYHPDEDPSAPLVIAPETPSPTLAMRKILEATFTVSEIQIGISTSQGKEIVTLCASNLAASLTKRSYDTAISLVLQEFSIQDRIQGYGDQFQHLAVSGASSETKQNLVSVNITQLDKESPDYDGVDITGSVAFGTLYLICNRETISALIQIFIELEKENPPTQAVADPIAAKEIQERSKAVLKPIAPAKQKLKAESKDHIKIHFSMETIGLRLNDDGKFIAEFGVHKLAFHIHAYENLFRVKGSLHDLHLSDMATNAPLASIVRQKQEESVLEFEIDKFNPEAKDYPGYDNAIKVNVRSIKMILLGEILSQLRTYFTDGTIIASIIEAAQERAAQAESLGIEDVKKPAGRTKLDVSVDSPVIVLPRSDANSESLVFELGNLRISNTFTPGTPVDTIKVELTKMNITSSTGTKGKSTQTPLVKEIDATATITRVLDLTLVDQPQVKITLNLKPLEFMLSDTQLLLMTHVFNGNLRKMIETPVASVPSDFGRRPVRSTPVTESSDQAKLQLEVQLEKISLQLSDQVSPIATFNVNAIGVAVHVAGDSAVSVDVRMRSIVLLDSRPTSDSAFKNLVGYKATGGSEDQFRLSYKRDLKNNQSVSVNLSSPVVYLVPKPVLALKDFLLLGINNLQANSPSTSEEAARKLIEKSHERKDQDGVDETPGTLKVEVHVVDPRIYLLDDATKKDTRAIVLKARFDAQYNKTVFDQETRKSQGDVANIYDETGHVELKGLEIALTTASGTNEGEDLPIIKGFDGVVKYRGSNQEQDIKINIQPVTVLFSYQDFKLLANIVSSMQPAPTAEKREEVLAQTKRREIAEIAIEQSGNHPSQKKEHLRIKCSCVLLTLINDYQGRNVPLTEVRITDVHATLLDWTSELQATAGIVVNADYYNQNVLAFEPLIEYWPFEFYVKKGKSPRLTLEISAPDQLGLNISHSLVASLGNLIETMRRDLYLPADDKVLNRGTYSPYWVINQTGESVKYQVESKFVDLEPNGRTALPSATGARQVRLDSATSAPDQQLQLQVGGSSLQVSLDQVGQHVFEFEGKPTVLCKVQLEENSKILTISSMTILQNNTDITLEFCLFGEGQEAQTPSQVWGPVESSMSIAVPLAFANRGAVGVRPAGGDHTFNTKSLLQLNSIPKDIDEKPFNQLLVADGESFHCLVTAQHEKVREYSKLILNLNAPLVIENLIPYPIICQVYDHNQRVRPKEIGKGDIISLYDINSLHDIEVSVSLLDFGDSKKALVHAKPEDVNRPVFNSSRLANKVQFTDLKGGHHFIKVDSRITETGGRQVSFNAPFWILNKTELKIDCRYVGIATDGPIVETFPHGNQAVEQAAHLEAVTDALPIIFSASEGTLVFGATKVSARIDKSKWSKSFGIESAGTDGSIQLPDEDGKHVTDLGVSLRLAKGVYRLTKIIEFHPRFMVFNELDRPLLAKQLGSDDVIRLEPGQGQPIYQWLNTESKERQIRLNFDDKSSAWSGEFSLEHLDDFAVKIFDSGKSAPFLVRTVVTQSNATIVIKFSKQPVELPPYVIENDTSTPFQISQKKPQVGEVRSETVEPGTKLVYAWDLPSQEHVLQVKIGNESREFHVDAIESYDPITVEGKTVFVYTHALATTKVFCLTENKDKLLAETTSAESEEKAKLVTETVKLDVKLRVKSIGISIIDNEPKELLYVYGEGIQVSFSESNLNQNLEVIMGTFQVDNQTIKTPFPVLLSQTVQEAQPFLHLSVVRSMENLTLDYITYFSFLMQEINVTVDDEFIFECLNFGKSLPLAPFMHKNFGPPVPRYPMTVTSTCLEEGQKSYEAGTYYFTYSFYPGKMAPMTHFVAKEAFSSLTFTNLKPMGGYTRLFFMSRDGERFQKIDTLYHEFGKKNDQLERFTTSLKEFDEKSSTQPFDGDRKTIQDTGAINVRQMFFKLFNLNSLKVNVTFMLSGENLYSDSPLRLIAYLLGTTMASLDNAPIRLNALVMEDAFMRQDELVKRIIKHYRRQAIQDLYMVLGSADFLGNPVGLFNNVGTGVKDFFYEPAQGLVKSPADFGIGLAKGSLSLAKHTTFGLFNTVSKLTGTTGKGLATLTLDDEYVRQRQQDAIKNKPQHVGEGLLYGAKNLGEGILQGVTGLVTQPIKGAQSGGALGFAKGLGRGLIGVGVKPAVGVTDFVTKTTEGIRNTTTVFDKDKARRRPPRFMEANKAIGGYSEKQSKGVYYLKTMAEGKYKEEKYIFHEEVENGRIVILTENSLFILSSNLKVDTTINYKDITEVDLAKEGILIKMGPEQRALIHSPNDRESTLRLYTKLEACVLIYTQDHPDLAPFKSESAPQETTAQTKQ